MSNVQCTLNTHTHNRLWPSLILSRTIRVSQLHMAQLISLPLTISCSIKSWLHLLFCYHLTWVVLDKGLLNGCCCFVHQYFLEKCWHRNGIKSIAIVNWLNLLQACNYFMGLFVMNDDGFLVYVKYFATVVGQALSVYAVTKQERPPNAWHHYRASDSSM